VAQRPKKEREIPIRRLVKPGLGKAPVAVEDPVVQATLPPPLTPSATRTFEGISNEDNFNVLGFRVVPPDTNGDVGPNDYVQTINLLFEVFTKTGTPRLGPITISSLFAGFGGPCETDDGDPVVLYDPLADRWLLSQFSTAGPPFHQCVALSQTGDPTGSYFRYDFVMPGDKFNDYPKFGVWPDAYYMTDIQFLSSFAGGGVFAFDRTRMLAGDPTASYIYFDLELLDPTIGGMLPADLDGAPPPDGTPNYFVYFVADEFGDPADGLRIFEFRPDFADPGSSTFTERTESPLATAAFDPNLCDFSTDCVPQPRTRQGLDALSDRLMYRLQYRNFGSHESLVVNHTVNVSGGNRAAVRYYELRRSLPGGSFVVNEQATFAPDNKHRWMGSAAMDDDGNLAVGYSHSGKAGSAFPSIRYAARLATDPPNGLFQGEALMFAGTGSQTSASGRWGDYSMLAVDPVDDCTFWFTSEFYTTDNTCPTTSTACFHTGIGSFVLPSCTPPPAPGTLQGTVRNAATNAPVAGALVQTSGGFTRTTSGTGAYSMAIPANTYDVTASRFGYTSSTASGIVVASGGTTTQDFALVPIPILALGSSAVDDSGGNGNGVVDFNECVGLSIVLQNQGAGDATGISATLSTTTPGVIVASPSSAYPNIAAAGSGANTTAFRIETAPDFVVGTIIGLTLQVTTSQGPFSIGLTLDSGTPDPAAATFSAAGPVPIPDNDPTGASLPLAVSGITSAISKVKVTMHLTHTFDADLTIRLIGPDGTTITLAGGVGGSGDNFGTDCPADGNDTEFDDAAPTSIVVGTAPFVGSFRPTGALSGFNGKSGAAANGTWTLRVIDNFAIDTGSIECWSLSINGTVGTDGGGSCP
jgi:subtilisin-like proprotein convertase family protein